MLRLLRIVISLFFIFYLSGCNKKPNAENIYESEEYKSITKKDLKSFFFIFLLKVIDPLSPSLRIIYLHFARLYNLEAKGLIVVS